MLSTISLHFCFFNDTATTEIYTLSLHDALPISSWLSVACSGLMYSKVPTIWPTWVKSVRCVSGSAIARSEEHTSELQSLRHLVCRLLLEKKKKKNSYNTTTPTTTIEYTYRPAIP